MITLSDDSAKRESNVVTPKVTQEHVNGVLEKNCVVLANKVNELLKIQQEHADHLAVLDASFKTLIHSLNGNASKVPE